VMGPNLDSSMKGGICLVGTTASLKGGGGGGGGFLDRVLLKQDCAPWN
jgi:transcriptional regulator of nitric oxide reductase